MDIVERLRLWEADKWRDPIHKDAADEIERLRDGHKTRIIQHEAEIRRLGIDAGTRADRDAAEIERLRKALQEIAEAARNNDLLHGPAVCDVCIAALHSERETQ